MHDQKYRLQNIISRGIADKVILGNKIDFYKVIEKYEPNIICLGYDQDPLQLRNEIKKRNLKIQIKILKPFKEHKYKTSILNKQMQ